ncbi:MAG TPA: hypothetical protein V6C52_10490 [Coleofasciculaceae cyanobacterium]
MGDVHLNNHEHPPLPEAGGDHRAKFEEFLSGTLSHARAHPKTEITLFLNGDIVDVTDSWNQDDPRNIAARRNQVMAVVKDILDKNPRSVNLIQALLQLKNVTILYGRGNHDRFIFDDEAVQRYITSRLRPLDAKGRFAFVNDDHYYHASSKTLILHGDRFDPSCCAPDKKEQLSFGEELDILLLKPLVQQLPTRLKEAGYSEQTCRKVSEMIQSMEYIRPIEAIFPPVFQQLRSINEEERVLGSRKKQSILAIALAQLIESWVRAELPLERFTALLPSAKLRGLTEATLRNRQGQWTVRKAVDTLLPLLDTQRGQWAAEKWMTHITQKLAKDVRSDENQHKKAREFFQEHPEITRDAERLVLGHTHKLIDGQEIEVPGRRIRLYNPGSFKATLLYLADQPTSPRPVFPNGVVVMEPSRQKPDEVQARVEVDEKVRKIVDESGLGSDKLEISA